MFRIRRFLHKTSLSPNSGGFPVEVAILKIVPLFGPEMWQSFIRWIIAQLKIVPPPCTNGRTLFVSVSVPSFNFYRMKRLICKCWRITYLYDFSKYVELLLQICHWYSNEINGVMTWQDCFGRPISSAPDAWFDVVERYSKDNNKTLQLVCLHLFFIILWCVHPEHKIVHCNPVELEM